jgi:hypothetical protein
MSERREKTARFYAKWEYINRFEKWLDAEPPIFCFIARRKWKKQRPKRTW